MKQDQLTNLLDEDWKSIKSRDEFGNVYYGTSDEGLTLGWLHYVCRIAPQLEQVEAEDQITENHPYWQQLRLFNGFNLFEGRFVLYGVHAHEEMNEAAYPFDWLLTCFEFYCEKNEKFGDITKFLPIGAIENVDFEEILLQRFDGKVVGVDMDKQILLNEWEDIDDLIVSEVSRLKSTPRPKDWIELN